MLLLIAELTALLTIRVPLLRILPSLTIIGLVSISGISLDSFISSSVWVISFCNSFCFCNSLSFIFWSLMTCSLLDSNSLIIASSFSLSFSAISSSFKSLINASRSSLALTRSFPCSTVSRPLAFWIALSLYSARSSSLDINSVGLWLEKVKSLAVPTASTALFLDSFCSCISFCIRASLSANASLVFWAAITPNWAFNCFLAAESIESNASSIAAVWIPRCLVPGASIPNKLFVFK